MSSIEHLITVADLENFPDDGNRYELNWIVDVEKQAIEIYRLKERSLEEFALFQEQDELVSQLLPFLALKVSLVFRT